MDAYIRTYRWQDVGEVRVPESQVERALALLPAVDAAHAEEHVERCAWCGSTDARLQSPFSRALAIVSALLIGWELYGRRLGAAFTAAFLALVVLALTKIMTGRVVCTNCGREWRTPR